MSDEALRTIRAFGGAVAIVTGGASGIGAALGRELARRGARVVLADRQLELASEIAASINGAGGKGEAVELDVRDVKPGAPPSRRAGADVRESRDQRAGS